MLSSFLPSVRCDLTLHLWSLHSTKSYTTLKERWRNILPEQVEFGKQKPKCSWPRFARTTLLKDQNMARCKSTLPLRVASPGCQETGSRMGYIEVLLLLAILAGAQLLCAAAFSIAPFNDFARQMTPCTVNWRFQLLPHLFYSLCCKHRPRLLCCTVRDSIIATDNQFVH